MKRNTKLWGFLAGFFGTLLLVQATVSTATAAPGNAMSITLSPVVKTYELTPGQTVQDEFIVFNSGQSAYGFSTYPNQLGIDGENYDTFLETNDPMADVNKWVHISMPTGHLDGGKMVHIPFTLSIPTDASPGAHTGVIFAQNVVDPTTQQASGVMTEKRVGMTIYVNIKGDLNLQGDVSIDTPFLQTTPPLKTHLRYTNTGNGYYNANATMKVYNVAGKKLYDSNVQQYTVLPKKPRRAASVWEQASWLGLYRVETTVTLLGKTTSQQGYVLIVPVWLWLLIGIAIVAGGLYAFVAARRRKK